MQQQLSSGQLSVIIDSAGAEVCSIKDTTGTELIWQADNSIWPRHAPVLFPIVGKLKDNAYSFEEATYTLSQHGFARDRTFELMDSATDFCMFQLTSDANSKQLYPFDFVFQVSYRLVKNQLITSYTVINPSDKPLFFSVGAHPGFNCPLLPDERLEDYYLEFERPDYEISLLKNGLRSGQKKKLLFDQNKLFLSSQLFENDALVFENNQINRISLCSTGSPRKITMTCDGWPYFGIWSKAGPFICLEPWYGIADSEDTTQHLTKKEGIICLEPGKKTEIVFSIFID